ncbi:hypothetical protein JW968_01885 [Candidatus Woesearchaeota archaeon]|nr:hypothetical protein [Candidatus Woesearchaeota archaeon]
MSIDLLILTHGKSSGFTPGIEVDDCISTYRVYGKSVNSENIHQALISAYNHSFDMAMRFMQAYSRRPVMLNLMPVSEDIEYEN